jgi:diacylglycerol kinase family enzyme
VGVEALTILRRGEMERRLGGIKRFASFLTPFLYALGAVGAIREMARGQRYNVVADGQDLSGDYIIINISNGPCYGGRMRPSPYAKPDDGVLNLTIGRINSTLQGLSMMPHYITGHPEKLPDDFRFLEVREVYINSPTVLISNMDRELLLDSDIHVSIVPRAVRFVTPVLESAGRL